MIALFEVQKQHSIINKIRQYVTPYVSVPRIYKFEFILADSVAIG